MIQRISKIIIFEQTFRDFSAIVDLTWGGWDDIQFSAANNGFPYLRIEATNFQFVQVTNHSEYAKEGDLGMLVF